MNNILNAQEAFAAVITGRNVLARLNFGNEPEEFAPISNFPADIYAKPHVEYCIQIETILINGFEFTKPYSLDELNAGQDVFLISHNGDIVKGLYIPESEELVSCVNNGSVQRDFENAQKHAKAIQSLLGIENDLVLKVVDFEKYFNPESKTKKRAAKKQSEAGEIKQQSNQAANDDNSSDDIIEPAKAQSPTSIDVEKKASTDLSSDDVVLNQLLKVDSIELLEKMEASFEKSKSNISDEKVQTYTRIFEQKRKDLTPDPELSVLCDAFVDEINAATSNEEIKAIRTRINSNGDLTEVESAELATRINLKSALFEKDQTSVPFENIAAAAVAQAKKVDEETQEREWTRFHNDKPYLDLGNKSQYEIEYADLSAVVIHAQSSDEANSVVEKTHHWTTDQRKPLLSLISKRLCELQGQSKVQPKEPPSLMVQIQNAPDLTALDALEIDVSARHPDIQPRLMGYVKKRRFELEQLENAANDGGHSS
ncbi:hypothetical protein [Acinetobacter modestus]|uniref:hypothetical protein n=1 Tax=Acinetobacter modestus TaxID=1776740 RepID=UPI001F4BAC2D|nr:hypothetical protein [Acinetobacter modestus]MCH7331874.1 hypothetical protein [Acinetobacter modestus]